MSERDKYHVSAMPTEGVYAMVVNGERLSREYHTQAERRDQVELMARDLVATMLDVDVASLDADFVVTVG